ncbi:CPBP family intramembrane glutamic endopeptidase [Thioclava electrotropha]|uniref:CPBP family intramembrane metalloprotease n=1 Tax=Thioclava electrotropha TaxID=1549850 RepID=A0ABX6YNY0_9RHOB|nr:type II CAAX endopeptidase family protein [Thioclava electrotropha]QPZ89529.1 CPBP family intramembrane metalloprotease [Thioclava electrotropha]
MIARTNRYAPLEAFAAPAKPYAQIWRGMLGLGVIVAFYLLSGWAMILFFSSMLDDFSMLRLFQEIAHGSTPRGLAILLASFAPLLIATFVVSRHLHHRAPATLFGRRSFATFTKVLPVLLLFALFSFGLTQLSESTARSNPLVHVLSWAPIALPLLGVQIATEEVLFRGYLLQQLAARWRSPLIWMVLPSALFGALHYSPGAYGSNAIWPALWAFGFGCLSSDLTARTGNLGAALALHFANNFGSLFLVGFYGQLDGLALYTIVINTRDLWDLLPWLLLDMLHLLIAWLLIRLTLRV